MAMSPNVHLVFCRCHHLTLGVFLTCYDNKVVLLNYCENKYV